MQTDNDNDNGNDNLSDSKAGASASQAVRALLGLRVTKRLACFALFWHFLDIVWIGVFTVVYLMGAM